MQGLSWGHPDAIHVLQGEKISKGWAAGAEVMYGECKQRTI